MIKSLTSLRLVCLLLLGSSVLAQQTKQKPPVQETKAAVKKKVKTKFFGKKPIPFINTALTFAGPMNKIGRDGIQCDLPAAVSGKDGKALISYLEWDGKTDRLILSREIKKGFQQVSGDVAKGVLHKPAITIDGKGTAWIFWSETHGDTTVDLKARSWSASKGFGSPLTLADSDAAEAFVVAGTDSNGRVWASWQSFRAGEADIYARFLDPKSGKWSKEIAVATQQGGDWEPSIAFDQKGQAWIVYDSSRGNEFNLNLARVNDQGQTREFAIAHSPKYEARASITTTAQGDGFWITAERGKEKHGLDYRGHGNDTGINAKKSVLFGKFESATGKFTEIPLGHAGRAGNPVNRPVVGVGKDGNPWVVYRYFNRALWRIAATGYRLDSKTWSSRRRIPNSSFGQDRTAIFLPAHEKGDLRLCWPSDERPNKAHQTAAVFLAALPSSHLCPQPPPKKQVKPQPRSNSHTRTKPPNALPSTVMNGRSTDKPLGSFGGMFIGTLMSLIAAPGSTDASSIISAMPTTWPRSTFSEPPITPTLERSIILMNGGTTNGCTMPCIALVVSIPSMFMSVNRSGHGDIVISSLPSEGVLRLHKAFPLSKFTWQKTLPVDPKGAAEISPYELWDLLRKYGQARRCSESHRCHRDGNGLEEI